MCKLKPLFEMPFVFSNYISPNEGFRRKFKEICGLEYERPKVIVIEKYSENNHLGETEWVSCLFSSERIEKKFSCHIENIPTDKEIAKNKKIYELWESTRKQINKINQ